MDLGVYIAFTTCNKFITCEYMHIYLFLNLKHDKLPAYHYEIRSVEVIDLTPISIIKYLAHHDNFFNHR
jgi:hypothetical protein